MTCVASLRGVAWRGVALQSLAYGGSVTIELATEHPTTCITLHSHALRWTAKDVVVFVNGTTKLAVTEVKTRACQPPRPDRSGGSAAAPAPAAGTARRISLCRRPSATRVRVRARCR